MNRRLLHAGSVLFLVSLIAQVIPSATAQDATPTTGEEVPVLATEEITEPAVDAPAIEEPAGPPPPPAEPPAEPSVGQPEPAAPAPEPIDPPVDPPAEDETPVGEPPQPPLDIPTEEPVTDIAPDRTNEPADNTPVSLPMTVSSESDSPIGEADAQADVPLTVVAVDWYSEAPITGVAVNISYWDTDSSTWIDVAHGITDGSGSFVANVTPDRRYSVDVSHPDYGPNYDNILVNGPAAELTLGMQARSSGPITVHVLDYETNTPIVGALVRLEDSSGSTVSSGETDDSGNFVSGLLLLTDYDIYVTKDGYERQAVRLYKVTGPDRIEVRLMSRPLASIEVLVSERMVPEPVDGAMVTVFDKYEMLVGTRMTDGTGRAVVNVPRTGETYTVRVEKAHYLSETVSATVSTTGSTHVDVSLIHETAGVLTILTVDALTNEPVPGVLIRVFDPDQDLTASGTTDEAGRFFTTRPIFGGAYTVETELGDVIQTTDVFVDGPTEVTVTLVSQDSASIELQVTYTEPPDSREGAVVTIFDKDQIEVFSGMTDSNGHGVFGVPRPGETYTVRVQMWHFVTETITVTAGVGTTRVDVLLVHKTSGALTVFTVDGVTGEPVPDVTVRVYNPDRDLAASGITDESGRFMTNRPFQANIYTVETEFNGSIQTTPVDLYGPTTVTITLDSAESRTSTLTITALDELTGQPIEDADVSISDPGNGNANVARGTTESNGQFSADVATGREYQVSATHDGYMAVSSPILVDGPEAGLTFQMTPIGAITFHIIDNTTGNPIGGVYVDVANDDHERVSWGRTDSSGIYTTKKLPAAEYSFVIYQNGHTYVESRIDLMGPTDLVFRLTLITPAPSVTPVPTETATPTVTVTPISTATIAPTATTVPTVTTTPEPGVTQDPSETPDPTAPVTPEPSVTPKPGVTPVVTVTPDPTQPVTPEPSATPIETVPPSVTPIETTTPEPSVTPVKTATSVPSVTPVETVTPTPSETPTATAEPTREATEQPLELSFTLCGNDDCTQPDTGADGYTVSWAVTGDASEMRQIVDNGAMASTGMATGAQPVSLAAYQAAQPGSWTITAVLQNGVATGLSEPLPLGDYTVCLNPLLIGPDGSAIRIADRPACDGVTLTEDGVEGGTADATTFSAVIISDPVVPLPDGAPQEPNPGSDQPGEGTTTKTSEARPDGNPAVNNPEADSGTADPVRNTDQSAELAASGRGKAPVAGLPVTGAGQGSGSAAVWLYAIASVVVTGIGLGVRRHVRT